MVKTTTDVMDINMVERMGKLEDIKNEKKDSLSSKKKEFEELKKKKDIAIEDIENQKQVQMEELENRKRKELDDLEKKKKELEELETQKTQEIEETDRMIEKSFQELVRHKKIIMAEEDALNKKTLEEVAETAPKNTAANVDYGRFFEKLEAPERLYQVANTRFYSNLTELRDKAARGEITQQEEEFIGKLRSRFESFESNSEYEKSDNFNYIKRALNIVGQIDTYVTKR